MKKRNFLIAYDISNNAKRTKVSNKLIEMEATRINKSVYVLQKTKHTTSDIEIIMKSHTKKTDSVYIIPLCKSCLDGAVHIHHKKRNKRNVRTTFV